MSGYRDDLEAAKARIADLEEQLGVARAQIEGTLADAERTAELAQLEKQRRDHPRALGEALARLKRGTILLGGASLVLAALAFWVWHDMVTRLGSILSTHDFPWLLMLMPMVGAAGAVATAVARVATRGAFAREDERRRLRIEALKTNPARSPGRVRVGVEAPDELAAAELEAAAEAESEDVRRARR